MKYFKGVLFLILLSILFQNPCAFAQNNYSSESIVIYNAGVAFQNQGKQEQAEQKYIQALKLQPNFTEAKKNLASVYNNLAYKNYSTS